ncbi:MAG: acyl-ACP--UDP-N-acetylglucosamine O-acyltransferase [Muribaculaceae bacterium]|nr:acyl-ACP--UDP-N-acetylglucosamine O-acyltransferase [Muribaculaceae bacterium]
MSNIHQFSSVNPDAKIASDVVIGPFTTIDANVEIGEGCRIGSNVTILSGARIGKNVTVFPGAVISAIPQDLKFKGEDTTAIIGDNCVIRECVTVNRGTAAKGRTVIGKNCLLMAYSHIAHDCILGDNIIISNASQIAGEVQIDDYAIIGGGSLIHQFCHIGTHIMMQGGALVNKDVPPYAMVGREPLCFTGLNVVGLRRRGFSADKIAEINEIYRIIYDSGRNISEAVNYVEESMPQTPERDIIIDFVRKGERGIVRAYTGK